MCIVIHLLFYYHTYINVLQTMKSSSDTSDAKIQQLTMEVRVIINYPLRLRRRGKVVCLSVTTLTARVLASAVKGWYQRNQHDAIETFEYVNGIGNISREQYSYVVMCLGPYVSP